MPTYHELVMQAAAGTIIASRIYVYVVLSLPKHARELATKERRGMHAFGRPRIVQSVVTTHWHVQSMMVR